MSPLDAPVALILAISGAVSAAWFAVAYVVYRFKERSAGR